MRKAFNFYNSHWEQIKLLKDKQKLKLFNAICEVQFLETNIEDIKFNDPVLNIVWTGLKHSILTSLNGFITKQKGLGKGIDTPLAKGIENPTQAPAKGPCQQEKGKEEEEEKGKEESIPPYSDFMLYAFGNKSNIEESSLKLKYESWCVNGWKDGNNKPIINWKSKLLNTIPYLKVNSNGDDNDKYYIDKNGTRKKKLI